MPQQNVSKFFLSIVLPSVAAIVLFIASLYAVFLPAVESAMVNGKRELIAEQTNTVWSLIKDYEREHIEGKLSLEQAQKKAIERVSKIRYGAEKKDYFWVINKEPRMIMHPYNPELNGTNLQNYTDPNGKRLFVQAVAAVENSRAGFVDYMWQWKDNPKLVVPKLSYVHEFEPWGWVIGTGVYLDDVEREVQALKHHLLGICLLVSFVIALISLFVIRQSLAIEKKRQSLTSALLASKRKYKTLVESSNQGILMFVNNALVFSNRTFEQLSGVSSKQASGKPLEQLLELDWSQLSKEFESQSDTLTRETVVFDESGNRLPVVVYVSRTLNAGEDGLIVSLKELSAKVAIENENEKVVFDIQSSLSLMEQPIKPYIEEILTCNASTTVETAAALLARKKERCMFVIQNGSILGFVSESDFLRRSMALKKNASAPVSSIMSAPIISIDEDALLYEALLQFDDNKVAFLATTNKKQSITGVISHRKISVIEHNTFSYLMHKIEVAERISELVELHKKVPSLVLALIDSGNKAENITRIISKLSDTFTRRILDLAFEKLGPAPCDFAFIAMGSEGRAEQTLSTDQDNAIIYDDVPAADQTRVADYFLKLGEFMAYSLDEVGYNYCKGGIMACNKKWNQPVSCWKAYFDRWTNSVEMEDIVDASVFFDFRRVYGSQELAEGLRAYVTEVVKDKTAFLHELADSIKNYKSPLGSFGKIVGNDITSNESDVDIKLSLGPVVKYGRLYALKYGYEETNTINRLKRLFNQEALSHKGFESILFCYNYLMQIRFRVQAKALLRGEEPSNKVDVSELTEFEVSTLSKIFSEIDTLPGRVARDFS